MMACVLVAAPAQSARQLMDALAAAFVVTSCSDPDRVELLATIGYFQVIVVVDGFAPQLVQTPHDETPILRVDPGVVPTGLIEDVGAAIRRHNLADQARSTELTKLTTLLYDEYLDLIRFRATRSYLLGLMRRHRGSVTEACRGAGIARESLHRQLRRHDVNADDFRAPTERG